MENEESENEEIEVESENEEVEVEEEGEPTMVTMKKKSMMNTTGIGPRMRLADGQVPVPEQSKRES